jgi:lipoic acid synthetase
VHPDEFERLRVIGEQMGFAHVASGPMVRSSYHADQQAHGLVTENAS